MNQGNYVFAQIASFLQIGFLILLSRNTKVIIGLGFSFVGIKSFAGTKTDTNGKIETSISNHRDGISIREIARRVLINCNGNL